MSENETTQGVSETTQDVSETTQDVSETTQDVSETAQDAKKANSAREQAIFQMACIKRGLNASTGPETFHVSRPTFWAWMNGKHKIPHSAFVRLVELDAQMDPTQWERLQDMVKRASDMGISVFVKPKRKRRKKKSAAQDKI